MRLACLIHILLHLERFKVNHVSLLLSLGWVEQRGVVWELAYDAVVEKLPSSGKNCLLRCMVLRLAVDTVGRRSEVQGCSQVADVV